MKVYDAWDFFKIIGEGDRQVCGDKEEKILVTNWSL